MYSSFPLFRKLWPQFLCTWSHRQFRYWSCDHTVPAYVVNMNGFKIPHPVSGYGWKRWLRQKTTLLVSRPDKKLDTPGQRTGVGCTSVSILLWAGLMTRQTTYIPTVTTCKSGVHKFYKTWEQPQNSRCHNGKVKKGPHWEFTNIRRHLTKFSRHSDLASGIGAQVVHIISTLHESWRLRTVFTTDAQRNLFWARWVQNTPSTGTFESFSHLWLEHPNYLFS
jgi:hypothetical protein